jgi:hypothetical protein
MTVGLLGVGVFFTIGSALVVVGGGVRLFRLFLGLDATASR